MPEHTRAQAVFPDGRVVEVTLPVWLLPLPGDLMTIPGEFGADGLYVPMRVTARLLQPEPIDGQPRVTLFVEAVIGDAGRPQLSVVK